MQALCDIGPIQNDGGVAVFPVFSSKLNADDSHLASSNN